MSMISLQGGSLLAAGHPPFRKHFQETNSDRVLLCAEMKGEGERGREEGK